MVGVGWIISGYVCPAASWVHLGYKSNLHNFCEVWDILGSDPDEKGQEGYEEGEHAGVEWY